MRQKISKYFYRIYYIMENAIKSTVRRKILKTIFKSLDYFCVLKYAFLLFSFAVFANLEKTVLPYSASIYVCAISCGCSIIPTTLIYLASFLILGAPGLFGSQAILCALSSIIVLIYRKNCKKVRIEMTACTIVGMLGFVFLGDTATAFSLEKRVLTSILTVILTFFCLFAGRAICEKGLKFKLAFEDYTSIAVFTVLFGTGTCNLVSPYLWRCVAVFIILCICYLYRTGTATLTASFLGVSFALFYGNLIYVSVFLCLALACESLFHISRYAGGLAIIMADYLIQLIFNVYGGYALIDFLSLLTGVVVFFIIPNKPLKNFKDKLYSFRERQLVRQSINRNRLMLSGKLYDLSGAFSEMAYAFTAFEKSAITEDKAKSIIQKQILSSICGECENKAKCKKQEKNVCDGLTKIIDIGFAKGKLSLIDLPKELGDVCMRPNNILYGLNKLLADFRAYALENANLKSGRDIIASQAMGVCEVLRSLAIETGAQLKYQSRLERTLAENLFKNGFSVSELLIYGEEERLSVSLIVTMEEFSLDNLQSIISKTVGYDMAFEQKNDIADGKCYLTFRRATEYDAVYGLSRAIKDGSEKSGDTYSVMRISGDRLMFALSDGMGSGSVAENVSSTSLSLIESFYKAGLSSPLILGTVNKLLSINTEDSFTALDLSVIDLKNLNADFIKYGSPYGFIVGDEGVRIVEGNSLPLGIIEELKPSVCSATLNDGDLILLLTDGISDAFGSPSGIIDFLRTQTAKNPQSLTDEILSQAISLNGGKKNDDMTALAVRVFKRKPA